MLHYEFLFSHAFHPFKLDDDIDSGSPILRCINPSLTRIFKPTKTHIEQQVRIFSVFLSQSIKCAMQVLCVEKCNEHSNCPNKKLDIHIRPFDVRHQTNSTARNWSSFRNHVCYLNIFTIADKEFMSNV